MQFSRIDFNLITQIVEAKEVVKKSVEAVLDEKLTASHLAIDVHALLDLLEMMEQAWKGTPPESGPEVAAEPPPAAEAPAAEAQAEPPPAAEAPAAEAQAEPPPAAEAPAEPPPAENS